MKKISDRLGRSSIGIAADTTSSRIAPAFANVQPNGCRTLAARSTLRRRRIRWGGRPSALVGRRVPGPNEVQRL